MTASFDCIVSTSECMASSSECMASTSDYMAFMKVKGKCFLPPECIFTTLTGHDKIVKY